MAEDRVIYTDGRDVTVTDTTLKVKNHNYKISGITRMCLWTIRPERWPAILLMLLGLAAAVFGLMGLVPADLNMRTEGGIVTGNSLALWSGVALFAIGVLILAASRERYAVRIGTAEGDKNALVSTKRAYVEQIVDALNKAFNFSRPASYDPGMSPGRRDSEYIA